MTASPAVEIECVLDAGDWPDEEEFAGLAEKAIGTAAGMAGKHRGGTVTIVLSDDGSVRALNAEWRGKDKPTNVLSFPAGPVPPGQGPAALGDIVLARQTLEREAAEEGKSLGDHFTHLVVHGFLHLLGYDHETDAEAETMEELERRVLHALAIDDPYA